MKFYKKNINIWSMVNVSGNVADNVQVLKNSMILKGGVKNIGHDLISTCIDL